MPPIQKEKMDCPKCKQEMTTDETQEVYLEDFGEWRKQDTKPVVHYCLACSLIGINILSFVDYPDEIRKVVLSVPEPVLQSY